MWVDHQWLAFEWAMVAISAIMFFTRLFVDVKGIRDVAWYRDLCVGVAFLMFIVYAALDSIQVDKDYFNSDYMFFLERPVSEQEGIMKIIFGQGFVYMPSIYLAKVDLMFLYHQLAPKYLHPRIFKLILVTWFFLVVGFLVQFFVLIFTCFPVDKNWKLDEDLYVDTCGWSDVAFAVPWAFHLWSDILVYAVPLVIIFNMQKMSMKQKFSAGAMFFVGFINVFCAVFLIAAWTYTKDPPWAMRGAQMHLSVLQQATAIWVVCMPQSRSFYRWVVDKLPKKAKPDEKTTPVSDSDGVFRMPSESTGHDGAALSAQKSPESAHPGGSHDLEKGNVFDVGLEQKATGHSE